jgi:aminopeptidase N
MPLVLARSLANLASYLPENSMTIAPTIHLADYTAPAFLIDDVHLSFQLDPNATRVISRISFRRNPNATGDLVLNGEDVKLISASIDGNTLASDRYTLKNHQLTVSGTALPDQFIWSAEVEIDPKANTSLSGLYMSKGMYCTQCEAEGFRRITFYPDRPDVMAVFTVRIEGSSPILLSNGNPTSQGKGWAEWHDPWPKPAYLFALVAGDLVSFDDNFTTMTGRRVDLKIWVREGDQDKCAYAMDALKRSMTWDEEKYGREYDLDLFQIVAVDDFNMGAMENKGLNIFNSKYVLASPETATDRDFELIEGIIAHEYFHNWTGNRITCRDWFQLSLKEGLTVFRDQIFSGDQRSHAVKRIAEVQQLRARQFREDAGPLAHPVQPAEYKEINNFYTATIYEKGAEVVSMLHNLVGPDDYRRALDLYFDRHDGQAATIDNWLAVFSDTTGRDFAQFRPWYAQAGTPRLSVSEDWQDGTYTLTFTQNTPDTPGQTDKKPMVIPIALGLLNPNGDEVLPTEMLEMTQASQSFSYPNLASRPVPSILRGFSAPVILERDQTPDEQAFLLAHDTDPFNKWEAGNNLATDILVAMTEGADAGSLLPQSLKAVALDETLDPAFRALALSLPSEDAIAKAVFEARGVVDPLAIHAARRNLSQAVAGTLRDELPKLYNDMAVKGAYNPDAKDAGKRALRGAALAYLTKLDKGAAARMQFQGANNMTEQLGALNCLLANQMGDAQNVEFYDQWQSDPLVIDKWFMLASGQASPANAVQTAINLAAHKDFDWRNPNRFRALIAGFASMNPAGFHDPSGAGYAFVADWLIRLDPINPQTTARMTTAFDTWRRYDVTRQALMQSQLQRIASTPDLSTDTAEMVGRILAG